MADESETCGCQAEDGAPANPGCPVEGDEPESCCCTARYKMTPHSTQMQDDLQKRLNRIIGQLGGVKSMIDDNRYCGDVLTQLAAAQSALRSVSNIVLENHMKTCVVEHIEAGDTSVIDEVMQLMRKFS